MTVKSLYPTVLPSLNLDFANSKKLDPRVTFTRASVGTFVNENGLVTTAASGAARFDHDPVTGKCLGLLVEEARTNNLLYSEQFDNGYWTKNNTAVTSNAAIAPDGTLTADLLYTTTSGFAHVSKVVGSVSSAPYTTTIYLKSAGFTWAYVYGAQGNHFAFFNLIDGTVGSKTAGITASSISSVGNGWYRCTVTQTVTYLTFFVGPADANGSTASTASGTSGIYAWGAQLEKGAFPTSYIPTVGSTVTRAADVASITGTNFSSWYNNAEGTVFTDFRLEADRAGTRWATQIGPTATTGPNSNVIGKVNNNLAYAETRNVSAVQYSAAITFPSSRRARIAYARKNLSHRAAFNGVLATAGTGTLGTPSNTVLFLGRNVASTEILCGTIARLAFYPVRLPDAQLQALTAT
jgi:hypothetical protein